jgi:hypothetical protein
VDQGKLLEQIVAAKSRCDLCHCVWLQLGKESSMKHSMSRQTMSCDMLQNQQVPIVDAERVVPELCHLFHHN